MADQISAVYKQEMRARHRARRRAMSAEQKSGLDTRINQVVLDYVEETSVQSLSAFWPFDGEPDLRPSLQALAAQGKTIALPVLRADAAMSLHQWIPGAEMQTNRFGIAEPLGTAELKARELDLLLVPLVAWDRLGGRLGMGGGHYDRLLELLADYDQPLRMGVAFGFQEVPAVPLEGHDIMLHGLACEHGWKVFDH